ncbi:MAG TPA: hypothetical protein VF903_08920, partial [Nitrospirota bacterium]
MFLSPVDIISSSFAVLLLLLALTPLLRHNQRLFISTGFSLTAVASFLAVVAGVWTVADGTIHQMILPVGLPDLPFHLRLDLLSGYFLVVVGLLAFFVSIYSVGYVKGFLGHRPVTSLIVFYAFF